MEYRLIRNRITGETLVIGSDGYLSHPLRNPDYLIADAEPCGEWWNVRRDEYNTALWDHPLWHVLTRHAPDGSADGEAHAVPREDAQIPIAYAPPEWDQVRGESRTLFGNSWPA